MRSDWKGRRGNGTRGETREGETRWRVPTGDRSRPGVRAWPKEGWGPKRSPSGAGSAAREARGRWRAARRAWQAAPGWGAGGGRRGSAGTRHQGSVGLSGAAWSAQPRGALGQRGVRAAAAPARTLALNSAAASTLFSDMVPGPGLAGSRGPGAGTEGPWTAEGGRGRNLAR